MKKDIYYLGFLEVFYTGGKWINTAGTLKRLCWNGIKMVSYVTEIMSLGLSEAESKHLLYILGLQHEVSE